MFNRPKLTRFRVELVLRVCEEAELPGYAFPGWSPGTRIRNVSNNLFTIKKITTRCSASEHGSLFPKQEAVCIDVRGSEGRGMKAESVERVIGVGCIESPLSVHPTVFDILTKPISDKVLGRHASLMISSAGRHRARCQQSQVSSCDRLAGRNASEFTGLAVWHCPVDSRDRRPNGGWYAFHREFVSHS